MSGSTTNLDLISSSQANKEVTANALFDAESPAALYGRRASTTANLTWGYYGGYLSITGVPTAVSNGTLTLTANSTNYVVANQSTGNVSVSTSTTDWNNTSGFIRLYSIVAGASTVTSYVDYRTQYHTNGIALGVDAGNALRVDQAPQAWVRLATTDLGNTAVNGTLSATGNAVSVFTGTANVTYHVRCLGNGTIVHNASVINIIQGAANISTSAGDTFDVEMVTANTCNVKNYVAATKVVTPVSQVRLMTGNGYGSTNNKIRRFVTQIENVGSDIVYADSAANGASFTITANGVYSICYSDNFAAISSLGISLNSNQLTTAVYLITVSDIISMVTLATPNYVGNCSATLRLQNGDVVRPHCDGAADGSAAPIIFSIVRVF